ncbi:probable calcium-binding protein CML25 [Cornus florida]|uniref:probable calcium-binding protein CML25 n=1 Tax=Cornus florida TaxID=4283 RepID=UPI00289B5665|nr:probable calcium-binding protein CML25 [Cornus florida]
MNVFGASGESDQRENEALRRDKSDRNSAKFSTNCGTKECSPPILSIAVLTSNFISHSQIEEELTQVFKKFNVNDEDKISSSKLGAIMGIMGNNTIVEELDMMIGEVDANCNKFINLNKFLELNTMDINYDEVLENSKDVFSVFDMDKNGLISMDELQNVMKNGNGECSLTNGVVFRQTPHPSPQFP